MADFHLSSLNLKPLQSHQMILHLLSTGIVIHVTKSKLPYTQVSVQKFIVVIRSMKGDPVFTSIVLI